MKNVEFINGERIEIDVIKKLEAKLNISFPRSFVDFVKNNNGAYVLPNSFKVNGNIESINNFYKVQEHYHFFDERLPDNVIPFACDAGDNQICFDFRNDMELKILFWDYEKESLGEGALYYICGSFEEFMESLFEFDE